MTGRQETETATARPAPGLLTADEIYVVLDVLEAGDYIAGSCAPWDAYEGDPADDPKVTEAGWRALLDAAKAKLGNELNRL